MVGFSVDKYKELPIIPIQQFRPESCGECKFKGGVPYSGDDICNITGSCILNSNIVKTNCPLKPKENEMNSEW